MGGESIVGLMSAQVRIYLVHDNPEAHRTIESSAVPGFPARGRHGASQRRTYARRNTGISWSSPVVLFDSDALDFDDLQYITPMPGESQR
jgi:hypothetical protein